MKSQFARESSVVVGMLSVIGVGVIGTAAWIHRNKLRNFFFNFRRNEDGTVVTAGTVDQPNADREPESFRINYQVDKDVTGDETIIENDVTVNNQEGENILKQRGNFNVDIKFKGEKKDSIVTLKRNVQIGAHKEEKN